MPIHTDAPPTMRGTPTPIFVPRGTCTDYEQSSRREWLETNGTGGFAMGTVCGANTRRYHGLLVASLEPPVDRYVLLAKIDEELVLDGVCTALGTNQYPGAIHPNGYEYLDSFRLDPFPTWTFLVGTAVVEKKLFLVQGEQTLVVRYRATRACTLRAAPFLAFRDFHGLSVANTGFDARVEEFDLGGSRRLSMHPYPSLPAMFVHHNGGPFERNGAWHYSTEYLEELARGLDFREDLYRIGTLNFELSPERDAWFVASLRPETAYDDRQLVSLESMERARRAPESEDPLIAKLARAADQFIVRRADGKPTAIAGYPWFADWGRDTMIALPGLFLVRGLHAEAREVLRMFLEHMDGGIIPNRFPDRPSDAPEYNTADATLWMFQAARLYAATSGDEAFLRDEFYPAAKDVIRWHELGTHDGIRVDPADGLLVAGAAGTQLTWMDARVGGRVVTPRHGKAVEISALWYNALVWTAELADRFEPRAAAVYAHRAQRVEAAFAPTFWNAKRRCLYDVINERGPDSRLRPNQIFAVSLPYPLLTMAQQVDVVRAVEEQLLTRVGLRTLAPGDPGYIGSYRGGPEQRDGAYHQGTVWPWLLGPFVRAYLRVFGRSPERIAYCRGLFRGLELHLEEACLGLVSEVFDADPPFGAGGAPAQAWSVAELLQTLAWDLGGASPVSPATVSRAVGPSSPER
jgi:predicted glycogen debranching enzyme